MSGLSDRLSVTQGRLRGGPGMVLPIVVRLGILMLVACADSGAERSAMATDASEVTSFLLGGVAGSFSVRALTDGPFGDDTAPPFIGIYSAANVLSRGLDEANQVVFPFAGLVGGVNKWPNRLGNFRVGDNAQLIARFYPNKRLIDPDASLRILPVLTRAGGNQCIQHTASGMLQLIALPETAEGLANCVGYTGSLSDFDSSAAGIEMALDLGILTEPGYFTFGFLRYLEIKGVVAATFIANDLGGAPALVNLTVNPEGVPELPPNVYAHGTFLPAQDGFGFSNLGDASSDLLPKALLATEFGVESVCFVSEGACAAINPYGLYLATRLQPHDTHAGLCNGLSVAATMLTTPGLVSTVDGKAAPRDYDPEAMRTIDLSYNDVRQLIASKQVAQYAPAVEDYRKNVCPMLTPTQVMDRIERAFNTDDPIAALTFYTTEHEAGHAVTPYALSDEGANQRRIYVYDSNFPSSHDRYIDIDVTPGAETWHYTTGTTAASEQRDYRGRELDNTLCPEPLSLYANQQVLVQTPGTTRFVDLIGVNAQVIDSEGRVSGADLDNAGVVNEIPDATLTRLIDTNVLTIDNVQEADDLPLLGEDTLSRYLAEAYVIRGQVVSTASQYNVQYMHSALLSTRLSSAYDINFIPDEPLPRLAIATFRAHANARFVTLEHAPPGRIQLRLFTTRNDHQVGYTAQIAMATGALEGNDSVGVHVDETGENYTVFSYDSASRSHFQLLREHEQYLIAVTKITADAVSVFQ